LKLKSLLRKLKTASAFDRFEWRVIGEAYTLFLKVRLMLLFSPIASVEKARGLSQSMESVEKALAFRDTKKSATPSPYPKQKLLQLFQVAKRYQIPGVDCLPTSLTKQIFFSRYHYRSQVHIGVRKENGKLKAHAWCDDSEKSDRPSGSYQKLDTLTPTAKGGRT